MNSDFFIFHEQEKERDTSYAVRNIVFVHIHYFYYVLHNNMCSFLRMIKNVERQLPCGMVVLD